MRKKIKLILTTLFITAVVIASIIEIGKILNISESNIEYNDFKKSTVTAGPPNTFTAGSLSGANASAMYLFIPDHRHFCAGHGWAIALKKEYSSGSIGVPDMVGTGNIRKEEVTYEKVRTVEMAQSIAYGLAFGASDADMQRIVWASDTWTEYTGRKNCLVVEGQDSISTNDTTIRGKATRFANFVYRALNDDRKIRFMVNSNNRI